MKISTLSLALLLAFVPAVHAQTAAPTVENSGAAESETDGPEGESLFPDGYKYPRIPIVFQPSADAPGLADFLQLLRTTAEKRDEAALKAQIAPVIFWARDFGGSFDEKASGEQNLRQAFQIGVPDLDPQFANDGWERLEDLLTANRIGVDAEHQGAFCLPSFPELADKPAAEKVFKEANMVDEWPLAWAYVDGRVDVLEKPEANGTVIASVESEAMPIEIWGVDDDMEWSEIILTDGRRGFVKSGSLGFWINEKLCVAKDASDAWKIVGYIGGGD